MFAPSDDQIEQEEEPERDTRDSVVITEDIEEGSEVSVP